MNIRQIVPLPGPEPGNYKLNDQSGAIAVGFPLDLSKLCVWIYRGWFHLEHRQVKT